MLTFCFGTLSSAVKVFRPPRPSENLPAVPISPPRDLHDFVPSAEGLTPAGRTSARGPPASLRPVLLESKPQALKGLNFPRRRDDHVND